MNDEHLLLRLRLARTPGIGPRTARLLEQHLGEVSGLYRADAETLRARGVPPRLIRALARAPSWGDTRAELADCYARGDRVLALGGPSYPERLGTIHDPPQVLSVRGALLDADTRAVAIVGARRATPEGLRLAHELAADLAAAEVTVVSGLARGVDTAAHMGALAAGGRTLAVLGSGLGHVYPRRNVGLAKRIVGQGALLSEFPADTPPSKYTFPQRNRIVSGLSLGVLVVEAGPRSGALITADFALQEGRDLFAIPGSPRSPLSRGTNELIRDGAHLVQRASDVLDVLFGVEVHPEPEPEDPILGRLESDGSTTDELIFATGEDAPTIMAALTRLEIAGKVVRVGSRYRRMK